MKMTTITWGLLWILAPGACAPDPPQWTIVERNLPGALMSVWGANATDVWAVGGDPDGSGPEVWHTDGASFAPIATGESGDLWWVFGFANGPVYLGGAGGMILRYENGAFTRMTTPGTATVFGIWGASPSDVWAVGGASGGASGAFAWRLVGDAWLPEPTFPAELPATEAMWKVYGRAADDVWLVGTNGKTVHYNGATMTVTNTNAGESLFTVHGDARGFVTVGGFGTGLILEHDGQAWQNHSPSGALGLIGVAVRESVGYAVGQYGDIWRRDDAGWVHDRTDFVLDEWLHGVWIDPDGGAFAVGGQVSAFPLVRGVLLHKKGP